MRSNAPLSLFLALLGAVGACSTPAPPAATQEPVQARPVCEPEACVRLGLEQADLDPSLAALYYEVACEKDYGPACTRLGFAYIHGLGVEANKDRALELSRKACELKDAVGCRNTGWLLEAAASKTPENLQEAFLAYDKACDLGDGGGCTNHGIMFREGRVFARDDVAAAQLFDKACRLGDYNGCTNLAWHFEFGLGYPQDQELAAEIYGLTCHEDQAEACSALGFMYQNGSGVEKNDALAFEYTLRACELGLTVACGSVSHYYFGGIGVKKNVNVGVEYAQKACDAGDGVGCNNLAWALQNGHGIPQDTARGVELYKEACEAGFFRGCTNFGLSVSDRSLALEPLNYGCAMGEEQACGVMKSEFNVQTPDRQAALSYFSRICGETLYGPACRSMEVLRMTLR